jgi:hypothetical protein
VRLKVIQIEEHRADSAEKLNYRRDSGVGSRKQFCLLPLDDDVLFIGLLSAKPNYVCRIPLSR